MSFVIVDALEEALVLAKYGRARRVSEDVDWAVAVWCFVRFLQWAEDVAWMEAKTNVRAVIRESRIGSFFGICRIHNYTLPCVGCALENS